MDDARSFWCYKCQHMVLVTNYSSDNNITCPCCGDGFLEQAGGGNPVASSGSPLFEILDAMAAVLGRQAAPSLLLDQPSGPPLPAAPYRGSGIFVLRGPDMPPRWINFGGHSPPPGQGLERLIQQLLEMEGGGNSGTPPASRAAMDAMPTVTITNNHLRGGEENSACAICKDDFVLGSKVRQMPCRHLYHQDCIVPWLSLHGSCPVCRHEVASSSSAARPSSSSSGRSGGFFSWPFRRRR